ncbi:probable mediator of RNA polymerase II transcription subunit 37e [Chenopodium quinoa]|uniref:probable mediator of RNA polymerase II transcription subunit 37e n=1 Tax=Chenopodium quinoa TaxID=63459 RepID=UPI000B774BC4|nr:probable mediator of RNA polymerase II transcription subunit 37e [Chenopodium quinoa]
MKKTAQKYKVDDEERKKAALLKNKLENYVYEVKGTLSSSGKKMNNKDKRKLVNAIEKITQWLEWNYLLAEAVKLEEKIEKFKSICEALITQMHHQEDGSAKASSGCSKIDIIELD